MIVTRPSAVRPVIPAGEPDVATYKKIQFLRFIAAALVIVTHVTLYYGDKILN